ncbi:MAG: efflux RND transporter periplasmic adaptor subunit [Pseudomonadota bacterium]
MPFKVSRSVATAGFILLALVAYFLIRSILRTGEPAPIDASEASAAEREAIPDVVVTRLTAEPHAISATFKGSTAADRAVTVRAETAGTVVSTPAKDGDVVSKGQLLCGLGVDSRAARKAEAAAAVDASRLEYEAASELAEKGWTSPNQAAAAKAALDAAEAALNAANVELGRTRLRAPFAGVLERRVADEGDYLAPGEACAELVDLDPIIIAVNVTDTEAAAMAPGQPARIALSDGRTLDGAVRFVSRSADALTRTFRIEAEAPNPDNAVSAGLTAELTLELGEAPAIQLTPALLVLGDDGRVGVRHVDTTDTVRFSEVSIVDDAGEGVWVTGLPSPVDLVAAGQDYVRDGVKVSPSQRTDG